MENTYLTLEHRSPVIAVEAEIKYALANLQSITNNPLHRHEVAEVITLKGIGTDGRKVTRTIYVTGSKVIRVEVEWN